MAIIQEEESLIDHSPKSKTKGGLKTMPFIIVNETLEKVASYGLQPNMVIYLMKGYNLEVVTATSILNIWSALSHGLALLGAFVSDSFFCRFTVVAIGSISSLFTTDRHIFFSDFEIPAGSFSAFTVITLVMWIALYDRAFVPLMERYTRQQRGLSPVLRMGIGLVLSSAAMALSAIIEGIRRDIAIDQKDIYPQDGPNIESGNMSAMWFVPQYALLGLADAFNAIGLVEFLYSELPKSMSSFVVAIFTLGMAASGFLGSLVVNVLDSVTSYGGEISWLSSKINKGHLDYYYWLLAFFNILNFLYFLLICRYNRPKGQS